jgi:hypothetical protein
MAYRNEVLDENREKIKGNVYHLFPKLKSSCLLLITLTSYYTKINTRKHACTHKKHVRTHAHACVHARTRACARTHTKACLR